MFQPLPAITGDTLRQMQPPKPGGQSPRRHCYLRLLPDTPARSPTRPREKRLLVLFKWILMDLPLQQRGFRSAPFATVSPQPGPRSSRFPALKGPRRFKIPVRRRVAAHAPRSNAPRESRLAGILHRHRRVSAIGLTH